MPDQEWTFSVGIRNAIMALVVRGALSVVLWLAMLWLFFSAFDSLDVDGIPSILVYGFAAAAGTVVGVVLSRGISEKAGFSGPVLGVLVGAFAAAVVIGGESIFNGVNPVAEDSLRYSIVGAALIVAIGWVVKLAAFDL